MRIGLSAVNLAIDLAPGGRPEETAAPGTSAQRIPAMPAESDLSHHRILVTNDDGIHARGLKILEAIARSLSDDVWVVAPDHERSGAGHSISMHTPIRLRQMGEKRYAVDGTPTDCALMAIHELMTESPPTVLLSGINRGANLAEDMTYSGTIAAAMEGTLLGIRSIALSQVFTMGGEALWATAETFAPDVIQTLMRLPDWPAGTLVNVNFPDAPPDSVSGVRITTQGQRPPGSFTIDGRVDTRHVPYFWVEISYKDGGKHPGTDLQAIHENAISVTPIQLDMTNHGWRGRLTEAFGS